ncbi:MAG: transcription antitermination factor NusB [Phycisphaerales bacterium]|nr:MAG: transcription antitermination factor NusB [Phycisphaerales bacterium]
MQALCQWEVHHDESPDVLEDFLDDLGSTRATVKYAVDLTQKFWSRRKDVDRRLAGVLQNWDLPRISPVDRNVMRVAVVELLAKSVPAKVAVNEAVEIAREYGGEDSPRFVNGILDSVLKDLDQPAKDGA